MTFGQFNFPSSNDPFQGFPSSFGAQQSLTPQSSSSFQSSPFRTEFSINHSPNSIASPFSSAQSSPFFNGFSNGFPQVPGASNGFPQAPGVSNGFPQASGFSNGFPQVPGVQSSNAIPSFHASNLQSLVSTIPNIPGPIQQGLRGFPGLQNFNFPATSFASPQSFSSAYNSIPQQQFTSAPPSAVSPLNNNFLTPFQTAPLSAPNQQPSAFNAPLQQGPQLTSQFSINHGLASSAASAFTNQPGISPSQRATTIQLAPPQPVQSSPPAPIQIPQQNFPQTLNPQPQNIPTSNVNAALQQPAPVHYASIGPKLQGDYKVKIKN